MANKIILTLSTTESTKTGTGKDATVSTTTVGNSKTYIYPILEDFQVEYQSDFDNMLDGLPGLTKIIDIMNTLSAVLSLGGTTTPGKLSMDQLLNSPRWKQTHPPKFVVKILLYTKTDVYKDVWLPAKELITLSILKKIDNKNYATPGMNLNALSTAASKEDVSTTKTRGQFVSVTIPGIIYLPMAFVDKVSPTFSKEVAYSSLYQQNFPLWAEIELSITGCYPANSELLDLVTDARGKTGGVGGGLA